MAGMITDYTLRGVSVRTLDKLRVLVALSRAKDGKYKTMRSIMDVALAKGAEVLNQEVRHGR